jgi:hypothetical protein
MDGWMHGRFRGTGPNNLVRGLGTLRITTPASLKFAANLSTQRFEQFKSGVPGWIIEDFEVQSN